LHRFNTIAAIISCHQADGVDPVGIAAALDDWHAKHLRDDGAAPAAPPEATTGGIAAGVTGTIALGAFAET
jgi:hypothetical protein